MSIRFCLSHVCFKWDFITLKVDIVSVENVDTDGIITLRDKVLRNLWSYDFYDMTLSIKEQTSGSILILSFVYWFMTLILLSVYLFLPLVK